MISIPIPLGSVSESVNACADKLQNQDLAGRLIATRQHFISAEKIYREYAGKSQLFTISPSETVSKTITLEEMKRLYKNRFSKLGSPVRQLYNRIRAKAKICPLCNARPVDTLDHYLAQSHHPDFVLTPINLIPACGKCNKDKLASNPTTLHEQTLHPYFDLLPIDMPWLIATVVEGKPLGIVFTAVPPNHWNPDLSKRLLRHFAAFHLNELYSAKASSEVAEILSIIEDSYELYGADGLRSHLLYQAKGRLKQSPHSWMAALYQGLAESQWFVDGGFRHIRSVSQSL